MISTDQKRKLISSFVTGDDLSTSDPYDVWKTRFGCWSKKLYAKNRFIALPLVAAITIIDVYFNNTLRLAYKKQEYPIVRALSAQVLINLYQLDGDEQHLNTAKQHLDWLLSESCLGYSGPCWGLGFKWVVSDTLTYDENTPLTTATPYILEAFIRYDQLRPSDSSKKNIRAILSFFINDICYLIDNEDALAASYAPYADRIVVNASSYVMYSLAMCIPYVESSVKIQLQDKITRLYNFILNNIASNGAILYSPEGDSFIDCFHSCFVLKNIIKTNQIYPLKNCSAILNLSYSYIQDNFFVERDGLYKRFSKTNKPGLVKYDLYDNAELLNLAVLMEDKETVKVLQDSISTSFIKNDVIYSQIDLFGRPFNSSMYRWAILPLFYAFSQSLLLGGI